MIKFKLFLTALLVAFYGLFITIYNIFESPIRGTANAQQLNDSVAGYGWSHFVANGGITHAAFWILVIALAIIWLSSIVSFRKSK